MRGLKGEKSPAGFYYEHYLSDINYIVKKGDQFGPYLGQVTRWGSRWRAVLGPGASAKGGTRDEAVLKALEKKKEMEKHVQSASGF